MSFKPFFDSDQGTPLGGSPYHSRIDEFLFEKTTPNNYPLIGFRPGFALQASELNEIQENFYLQQTLMATMISNWTNSAQRDNNQDDVTFGPGWGQNYSGDASDVNGLTPISPEMVAYSVSAVDPDGAITFKKGWYLAQIPRFNAPDGGEDKQINLKIWMYLDTDIKEKIAGWTSASDVKIGLDISQAFVDENEDQNLSDPSNSATNTIPGATRYKPTFANMVQTSNYFNDIPVAQSDENPPYSIVIDQGTVKYLNGHIVYSE